MVRPVLRARTESGVRPNWRTSATVQPRDFLEEREPIGSKATDDYRDLSQLSELLGLGQRAKVEVRLPNWQLRGKLWTEEEQEFVGTMPDIELVKQLGRTLRSIEHKRAALGLRNPVSGCHL